MKRVLFISLIMSFTAAVASAQSNKIVFGPLEGNDAGVLTVHNGEAIEVELWLFCWISPEVRRGVTVSTPR